MTSLQSPWPLTRLVASLRGSPEAAGLGEVSEEQRFLDVERTLNVVRWLAIIIVGLAAPFAGMSREDLSATYVVILLGAAYTSVLQMVVIRHHPRCLAGGYLTSLGDSLLVSLAVFASGAGNSPLFLAYFLVIASAAIRYGLLAAIAAAVASMGLFTLVTLLHPGSAMPEAGVLMIRLGMLLLIGLMAGYLAQRAQDSNKALSRELARTRGLHAQSEVLARENFQLSADLRRRLAELQRTQAQLVQSAKLAAIGETAAYVAHEINNPLAAMLTIAELQAEDAPPDSDRRAELLTIRDEALRARSIVRSLLDLARQGPAAFEVCRVRDVLESTLPLVRKRAAIANVEIVQSGAVCDDLIVADPSQIKQVFLNLLVNAIDAMPDGGTLSITIGLAEEEAVIVFRDTGVGIRPEDVDRVFEPFFTTKSQSRGTGLGLSVSYGIVSRHGGRIEVTSTPREGTAFTVALPVAGREAGVG